MDDLPNPELHWIISDRNECITVEFVKEGMMIYDNKVGVLTNNPIFPYHIWNLSNFYYLTNKSDTKEESLITDGINFHSRGRGSLGLPGDYTSASRFVRASYVKANSPIYGDDISAVNQCFHILDTVAHPEGVVMIGDDYEITQYSSVCDAQKGIYYIKTYKNSQISAVSMMEADLDNIKILTYKIPWEPNIVFLKNHR